MSDFHIDSRKPDSSGKSSGIGGTIFLILFATPFAGFGVLALVQGVRKWLAGNTKDGPLLCLFGLIFSLVGFGLMFGAIWGRKKLKQKSELEARFAGKPWMTRPDWADGKIKSTATAPVGFFLLWSFLALALSAPAVLAIPHEWQKGNYAILVALLFPAVALGLLGYTFKLWRSHRRFGDCFFEPAQTPIPLGGVLEGMIETGKPLKLEHELNLKFSCIRRVVTGSGKSRSTNEYALWQDEKIYSERANLPDLEAGHTGIPVHFKLPDDQPECYSRGDESVFWRLEAKSKLRGPDFRVAFDLPVFKIAGAETVDETEAPDSDPTAALQAPIEEVRRDEKSRIKVSDGPNGREFYFPPARNIGTALFTTLAMFLFNGLALLLHHLSAPVIFPIVFGLVGILFILGTFSVWFKSSRMTIDSTSVRLTNNWLLFSRTRQFPAGDVARFATKAGMQSGAKVFSDIRLVPRGSDEKFAAEKANFQDPNNANQLMMARFREAAGPSGVTVASSIASVAEADWLVAEMNKALGRK